MFKKKSKNHIDMNEGIGYKIFMVFNYLFMIGLIFMMAFPYINVLAKAFNEGNDTARGGILFLPRVWTVTNFKAILSEKSFYSAAVISVVRVLTAVILGLLVQFSAAYALSKKKYPFKKLLTTFFLIPSFIAAGLIPQYVLFSDLGLLNNFWVYILPTCFSFYNMTIIRSFIQTTIHESLYESAYLDGATDVRVFFSIVLPLSKPILATIALWIMVNAWNDWTTTLYYITKPSLYTLQYKMMELVKESEKIQQAIAAALEAGQDVSSIQTAPTSDALTSAQVIITTLPIICVYPFLQKYFVQGLTVGAVKE